jgi:hypothetical protein
MKKKIPKPKLRNVAVNLITVHSYTYGEHTRTARGSIKPAHLNDILARKSKELGVITAFASEVHTLLKQYAGAFKESLFWQNMLSRLHTVTDITPPTMLRSLAGLELNSRYPLRRFGNAGFLQIVTRNRCMVIHLKNNFAPYFKKPAEEYCYDVIVLFFNSKGVTTGSAEARSRWLKHNEAAGEQAFTFSIPADSTLYLVCLRLHTGCNGVPTNGIMSQGMRIMESGNLIVNDA